MSARQKRFFTSVKERRKKNCWIGLIISDPPLRASVQRRRALASTSSNSICHEHFTLKFNCKALKHSKKSGTFYLLDKKKNTKELVIRRTIREFSQYSRKKSKHFLNTLWKTVTMDGKRICFGWPNISTERESVNHFLKSKTTERERPAGKAAVALPLFGPPWFVFRARSCINSGGIVTNACLSLQLFPLVLCANGYKR